MYPINPLAVSNAELYGSHDEATHEWQDGILARIMRTVCSEDTSDQKWILFDGPVDTLWIESMNSVLDDNKVLTLINSDSSKVALPMADRIISNPPWGHAVKVRGRLNKNNLLKVATKSIVASRVVPRLGVSVPTVDFVFYKKG